MPNNDERLKVCKQRVNTHTLESSRSIKFSCGH